MKSLFLLLLISNSINSIGQKETATQNTNVIEAEAKFPGGSTALIKYIHNEFD